LKIVVSAKLPLLKLKQNSCNFSTANCYCVHFCQLKIVPKAATCELYVAQKNTKFAKKNEAKLSLG